MVEEPHKQDSALTMQLLENALFYLRDSSKFVGAQGIVVCSGNARNYRSSLVAQDLIIQTLPTGLSMRTLIHKKPGDEKTLLEAFKNYFLCLFHYILIGEAIM